MARAKIDVKATLKAAKDEAAGSPAPEEKPEESAGLAHAVELRVVRFDQIADDQELNPREKLDYEQIERYAETYRTYPKSMPRPVLFDDGVHLWLGGGNHRIAGASDAGLAELECEVRRGTRNDAILFGPVDNLLHGVRMTRADLRKAVRNILKAMPERSNRSIAELLKVSDTFVGDLRREMYPNVAPTAGKDGKVYPPKKKPSAEERPPEPEASVPHTGNSDEGDFDPNPDDAAVIVHPMGAPHASEPAKPAELGPAGLWMWMEGKTPVAPMDKLADFRRTWDADLRIDGETLTGTVCGAGITNGTYSGGKISFEVGIMPRDGTGIQVTTYEGKFHNNQIVGRILRESGVVKWEANRMDGRMPRDQLGRPIPNLLRATFEGRAKLMEAARHLASGGAALDHCNGMPEIGGFLKTRPHLQTEPRSLAAFIRRNLVPYCVCPICDGDGDSGQCPTCGGRGWLSRKGFDDASEPAQERARSFRPGDSWEGDDPVTDTENSAEFNSTRYVPAGPGLDPAGHEIPQSLRDLFAADWLQDMARRIDRDSGTLRSATSWLHWLKPETFAAGEQFARLIRDAIPYTVCTRCGGKGVGCGDCKTSGYLPKHEHDNRESQSKQHRADSRAERKRK